MAELTTPAPTAPLDAVRLRADFPILSRRIDDRRLVYLDSAASSQKPTRVLDAMRAFEETSYANVHRGVYRIAAEATDAYEGARARIARHIGAPATSEVVFTKNVTEAFNLVAHSWGRSQLHEGDVVVLSEIEHHANLVPWLMLAEERGVELRYLPVLEDHTLDLSDLDRVLDGARMLSITAKSNVLGTVPPLRRLVDAAHAAGALVMVDGAQHVPHSHTDVADMGADLFAFTGHKCVGPTGIGVLWGRQELLDSMPAFMGGGDMIRDVRLDGWTPNDLPWKFEAGTPPITQAVGLAAALDYLADVGFDAIDAHETALTAYAMRTLTERLGERITIHGPAEPAARAGILSFELEGVHPHDVSQVLDERNVCVRAGHHCAKPLMRRLGVGATARASFYLYNDIDDVDELADALEATSRFFGFD